MRVPIHSFGQSELQFENCEKHSPSILIEKHVLDEQLQRKVHGTHVTKNEHETP